ncbi:MAG TPA: hypothetical protein VH853_16355 [Polyangia bacterium]|nr:hypothetical protein [Polyangia bacterium]
MRRVLLLCVVVAIAPWLGAGSLAAQSPPMRGRLVGSWEGVVEGDFRVFRVEITARDEESIIAMTAGQTHSVTMLFRIKRIDLQGDGITLDGAGMGGPDDLALSGV